MIKADQTDSRFGFIRGESSLCAVMGGRTTGPATQDLIAGRELNGRLISMSKKYVRMYKSA